MIIYSELAVLIADEKYFDIVIPRHIEGVIFSLFYFVIEGKLFYVCCCCCCFFNLQDS